MSYLKTILNRKATPQNQPIPGSAQTQNSAGGYSFLVSDWTRLERFLILGSEGGSYYATEQKLTLENAKAVQACVKADGLRAVALIVAVSDAGRAPKNDPAKENRVEVIVMGTVCRTGTHLFHFAEFIDGMRGWGRGLRRAVGGWYADKTPGALAYQAVKYGQRDGWSHRDLLRLSHPAPESAEKKALYHWVTQGALQGDAPALVKAFETAKAATDAATVVALIREARLPREAIPTPFLKEKAVWEALQDGGMPLTALVRNLATLTRVGVFEDSEWVARVAGQLADAERLKAARVHPITLLSALKTYAQGHGERGQNAWTPVGKLIDALDSAFYASFGNAPATGKRWVLALDVSGSMGMSRLAGVPGLTPRDASAALALLAASTESDYRMVAFQDSLTELAITPRQRLDDVVKTISGMSFGATDCAQPMLWALKNKVKADVFAVYTDSETWFGKIHPAQALRRYREETGIAAKLIVVGMVGNNFTIADPEDAGMLDVVGFDTAAPDVMRRFAVE